LAYNNLKTIGDKDVAFKEYERLTEECKEIYEILGVDTDINKRWENGVDHHPRSEELMAHLKSIDFYICGDHFCWKTGGDGDNGESLMYEMDVYFEYKDKLGKL
jgi:hypothetical protein